MSTFPPRSQQWFNERAAKMRAAKVAKAEIRSASLAPSVPAKRGPGRMKGDKVIRLALNEEKTLAEAVAPILLKQGISFLPETNDRAGSEFLVSALRTGQVTGLRPERRKTIKGRNSFGRHFYQELKAQLKLGLRARTAANGTHGQLPAPTMAPAPAPITPGPVVPLITNQVMQSAVSIHEAPTEFLVATLVARLFKSLEKNGSPELEKKVSELREFNELITSELSELRKQLEALTPTLRHTPSITPFPPQEKPAVKLPRVAILGCRKEQFDFIEYEAKKLGLNLDLRHFDQDQKPVYFQADYAISMRWVRHHWDDHTKESVPAGRYVFLRGGMGQAVVQLREWFDPQFAKASA